MTLRTNARIAGIAYLVYIVAGLSGMALSGRAMRGEGITAKLATIAQHQTDMAVVVLLNLVASFCALVLGVTLYAITREEDADLAMLGMICRVIEGMNGAASLPRTLALVWLATASGPNAPDAAGAMTLGAYLFRGGAAIAAIFFAVGSTIFSWLLLRGRMVPMSMAWLGVVSSALVVVALPLELVGAYRSFGSLIGWLIWMPLLAFELWFAVWLIVKGVAAPKSQLARG